MYFTVSLLPISTTSGALLPAIDASSFVRWSDHCEYCTSTVTPGCCCSNVWVAALTTSGQFCCAPTCSQTVTVVAEARACEFTDAPPGPAATSSASSTAAATPTRLLFMRLPQDARQLAARSPCGLGGSGGMPAIGSYQWPLGGQ